MKTTAFVLAAGLGTRLRPITSVIPKPAVSIGGIPILYYHLFNLVNQGFSDIHVNTHYLPEEIERLVNRSPWKSQTTLHREDEILGTGGAYSHILPILEKNYVLSINGDIFLEFDYASLLKQVIKQQACAALVVLPYVIKGETPLVSKDNYIISIGKNPQVIRQDQDLELNNFACIQVLGPKLAPYLKRASPFSIMDVYREALQQKEKIIRLVYKGPWFDIGSFSSLYAANMELLRSLSAQTDSFSYRRIFRKIQGHEPLFVPPNTVEYIKQTGIIGPALVTHPDDLDMPKTRIGPNALFLPSTITDTNEQVLRNVIVYSWSSPNTLTETSLDRKIVFADYIIAVDDEVQPIVEYR